MRTIDRGHPGRLPARLGIIVNSRQQPSLRDDGNLRMTESASAGVR